MFKEVISNHPLAHNDINRMSGVDARYSFFGDDCSLSVTSKLLFEKRLEDGEKLVVQLANLTRSTIISPYNEGSVGARECLSSLSRRYYYGNTVSIIAIGPVSGFIDKIKESFPKFENGNYTESKEIESLFSKSCDIAAYIDEQSKSTVIFVGRYNIRVHHLLQCGLLGFAPWIFNKNRTITDDERELIYSLRESTSEKYLQIVDKMFLGSYYEDNILSKLVGFSTRGYQREYESLENSIIDANRRIDAHVSEIMQLRERLRSDMIRASSLKQIVDSGVGSTELFDYLKGNNRIIVERVNGDNVVISIKTEAKYFDEGLARSMVDDEYSSLNGSLKSQSRFLNSIGVKNPTVSGKKVFERIFCDQEYDLKLCACFEIGSTRCRGVNGHEFSGMFNDYFPNSHIQRYACLGDYGRIIDNALQETGDLIVVIEQCVASASSINFSDPYVMSEFFSTLLSNNKSKCIVLDNGEHVTFVEAMKKYEEEQETEG